MMDVVDTAVIPVAGLGTRMLPVSRLVPKEFLPLGRKSAIHRVAEELCRAGLSRLLFVVSPRKANLENLFGNKGNRLEGFEHVEFEYLVQEQQLGLGHAILCAAEAVKGQSFAVALGDCLIGLPDQPNIVSQLIDTKKQSQGIAIGFEQVPKQSVSRYGIAIPDSEKEVFGLKGLVEKPSIEVAPSDLAVCGRYLFDPEIIDALQQTEFDSKNEIQLTDAINKVIENGSHAWGVRLQPGTKRYDIGNMESYTSAFAEFALHDGGLRDVILKACQK